MKIDLNFVPAGIFAFSPFISRFLNDRRGHRDSQDLTVEVSTSYYAVGRRGKKSVLMVT